MNELINATILAIDDELFDLVILEELLQHRCKKLFLESDIEVALLLAREQLPDIILLDIMMGDVNGYAVCCRLKADSKTQAIPVIFLTTLMRTADKVKAFEAGGVDYICKPFEIDELVIRIENCLRLHAQIHQKQQLIIELSEQKIKFYQLSSREVEILKLYALGYQRSEIDLQLSLSRNTVKTHLRNIFSKLNIHNRTQAIAKAREIGLIT
ncbi:MAG: DNA-binding response regulator [Methylococcaceae bacterium]